MVNKFKHFKITNSESGFALIAAIIACVILMALAILVIDLSVGDLRTTTKVVGDKMALSAAESGIQNLTQNFDPSTASSTFGLNINAWQNLVDSAGSQYRYIAASTSGLSPLPLPGYSMDSGKAMGMARYDVGVEGQNTNYNSTVQIDVGVGYGPVPIGTEYH